MDSRLVTILLNADGTIAELTLEPGVRVFVWDQAGSRCRTFESPDAFAGSFYPSAGHDFAEMLTLPIKNPAAPG